MVKQARRRPAGAAAGRRHRRHLGAREPAGAERHRRARAVRHRPRSAVERSAQSRTAQRPPLSYELRKLAKSAARHRRDHRRARRSSAQTELLVPGAADRPGRGAAEAQDRAAHRGRGPRAVRGPTPLAASSSAARGGMGSLDVYDGDGLAPARRSPSNDSADVPDDGIVDQELFERRGVQAAFTVARARRRRPARPAQPRSASSPRARSSPTTPAPAPSASPAARSRSGLRYTVAAAVAARVDELRASRRAARPPSSSASPRSRRRRRPSQALLDQAAAKFDNEWDRFDFLRTYVLDEVTATGAGHAGVDHRRRGSQEILGDTLEASPFEIVAAAGDAGPLDRASRPASATASTAASNVGDASSGPARARRQLRRGLLPGVRVAAGHRHAEARPSPPSAPIPACSSIDPNILPSNDIAVQLYLPALVPPPSHARRADPAAVLIAVPLGAAARRCVYVPDPGRSGRLVCAVPAPQPRRGPPAREPASRWPTPSGATTPTDYGYRASHRHAADVPRPLRRRPRAHRAGLAHHPRAVGRPAGRRRRRPRRRRRRAVAGAAPPPRRRPARLDALRRRRQPHLAPRPLRPRRRPSSSSAHQARRSRHRPARTNQYDVPAVATA